MRDWNKTIVLKTRIVDNKKVKEVEAIWKGETVIRMWNQVVVKDTTTGNKTIGIVSGAYTRDADTKLDQTILYEAYPITPEKERAREEMSHDV